MSEINFTAQDLKMLRYAHIATDDLEAGTPGPVAPLSADERAYQDSIIHWHQVATRWAAEAQQWHRRYRSAVWGSVVLMVAVLGLLALLVISR